MTEVKIKCGDPLHKEPEEPASYTRFVLPFSYRLKMRCRAEDYASGQPLYDLSREIENPIEREEREKYFTKETADVIFKRAGWFILKPGVGNWVWKYKMYFKDDTEAIVNMAPPALILFELKSEMALQNRRGKPDKKDEGLLHSGFLVIDLNFPKEEEGRPSLDNLLELNELFRYFEQPYPEHAEGSSKNRYKKLLRDWPLDFGELERDQRPSPGEDSDPEAGVKAEKRKKTVGNSPNHEIYLKRWLPFLEVPILFDGYIWDVWGQNQTSDWKVYPIVA